MNKASKLVPNSAVVLMCPDPAFGKTCFDSDVEIEDKRVAHLLVLLQQLDESAGGLAAWPKPELSEIVSIAVQVCGFVGPIEARDVIGTVLDAIELRDLSPESS